jgi:hypothetical protein
LVTPAVGGAEGDKVVVLRGPREGSAIIFQVDSLEEFWERATTGVDPNRA